VQVVESGSGIYRVVWADQLAPEDNRFLPTASPTLNSTTPPPYESSSPTASSQQPPGTKVIDTDPGLEKANTMLTLWSFDLQDADNPAADRRSSVAELLPDMDVYPYTLFTSDATLPSDLDSNVPSPPPNSMRGSRMS